MFFLDHLTDMSVLYLEADFARSDLVVRRIFTRRIYFGDDGHVLASPSDRSGVTFPWGRRTPFSMSCATRFCFFVFGVSGKLSNEHCSVLAQLHLPGCVFLLHTTGAVKMVLFLLSSRH
jgi:hypothetical protein